MKALEKSLLELGRVILLSIIPVVVASISIETGEFKLNLAILAAVGSLAALRWFDKFLHELGKEKNIESLTKGIVRF